MEEDKENLKGLDSLIESHLSWESTRGFFPDCELEGNKISERECTENPQYQKNRTEQDNYSPWIIF